MAVPRVGHPAGTRREDLANMANQYNRALAQLADNNQFTAVRPPSEVGEPLIGFADQVNAAVEITGRALDKLQEIARGMLPDRPQPFTGFASLAHTSAATRTRPDTLPPLSPRTTAAELARAGLLAVAHTTASARTRPDTIPGLNAGRPWLAPEGG